MSEGLDRTDARSRPYDPAGTRPKVDPQTLEPTNHELLLPIDAEVVDSTAEEEELLEPGEPSDLLPQRRAAAGVGAPLAPVAAAHAPRFQFILGALIALGVTAIAATAAVVANHHSPAPPAFWSSWRPTSGGGNPAAQIASHVAPEYRLPSGHELVMVSGGSLSVNGVPIQVVLRADPSNGGNITMASSNGVLYQLCGLGPQCSIDEGKPSHVRSLLLQREALELALYTFHYVDGVNDVVVILPPPPGSAPSHALFFRPSDLAQPLIRPLPATLSPRAPTTTNFATAADSPVVVSLTTPTLYNFSVSTDPQSTSLQLVLSPFSVTAPGSGSGSGSSGGSSPGGGSSGGGSSGGSSPGSGSSGGSSTGTKTATTH